jgi:hypothetical protein
VNRARLPIFILVPVALLALVVLGDRDRERSSDTTTASASAEGAATLMPVAAPAGALTSTFFCPAGTAGPNGEADAFVLIANPGDQPLHATVTVYPGAIDGDQAAMQAVAALAPKATTVDVPARGRITVHLADVQASQYAAALVEVDGGGVAVEHRVTSKLGSDGGPCASAPSATWYLPSGSDNPGARELLSLFNPFPDDAVVDVEFVTSDGSRIPDRLGNYVVPGGRLVLLDVNKESPLHEQVATSVTSVSGRLVVGRIQSFDGSDAKYPAGIAATLAAPQTALVWMFAEGQVAEGVGEVYTLYNPGEVAAEVDLEISLDDPDVNGTVDPIAAKVPPRAYVQVVMQDQGRVPPGVAHSVTVRSRNGVPIVPERVITASDPSPRHGYAPALGSPLVANRWLFADGRAGLSTQEWLILVNPSSDSLVRFSVTALAKGTPIPIEGLQQVEIQPGGRLAVELSERIQRGDLPLVVDGDGPLVVERGLYGIDHPGISLAAGIPLSGVVGPDAAPPSTPTTTEVPAASPPESTPAESTPPPAPSAPATSAPASPPTTPATTATTATTSAN